MISPLRLTTELVRKARDLSIPSTDSSRNRWLLRQKHVALTVALDEAVDHANTSRYFDQPNGNRGIQFPLARSLERPSAAELVLHNGTWLYDNGKPCGREASMAKYLGADAGCAAADRALQTPGDVD